MTTYDDLVQRATQLANNAREEGELATAWLVTEFGAYIGAPPGKVVVNVGRRPPDANPDGFVAALMLIAGAPLSASFTFGYSAGPVQATLDSVVYPLTSSALRQSFYGALLAKLWG